jgi:hypothetical protein
MTESTTEPRTSETPQNNGAPAEQPPTTPPQPVNAAEVPATTRARGDDRQAALRVALTTSYAGKGILRFFARIGEELSDLWAEAQSSRWRCAPR